MVLVYKHRKILATTAETIGQRSYCFGVYSLRGNKVTRVSNYRGIVTAPKSREIPRGYDKFLSGLRKKFLFSSLNT